ncbi:DNA-binding transcriptional LysR family regulator [Novosphingobium chloroacetimidivorans]|uniref:DNA-binding transcriptional LysR family regulator n=1 Tax=Novosphingobium chloroacetimidivorans TaxID=1428314 RepID=A0A7W7NWP9_9SPHN|nr:LysR substrate-binding domain-containing protein [Novosphingobium chloroacetimidivorans]MBB4858322.1 DNA-binding transcriptional LysR family regulator [Novosphingobium chloroacetimidivorans]
MHISLGSLHVFDAAARHLSFKAAANELNLSPSAVSHAIAKLERDLGAILFDRDGRQLALTLDGRTLHRPVEEALALVRSGIKAVTTRQAEMLRLHAAPSFAAQWLTPRLHKFLAANPGMEVQIAADTDYSRFTNDEFDADIVYGLREQEGMIVHPLGEERISPLCAPELAARIAKPADLLSHVLICSTLKSVQWDNWLRINGLQPGQGAMMRFDRSFMAISAAADGLGICLDSTRLAERELTSGRLVAPLAGRSEDLLETGHYLVYPKRNATRPIVKAFTRWVLAEIADGAG